MRTSFDFDRPSNLKLTLPRVHGWIEDGETIEDVLHRAKYEYGGIKINGAISDLTTGAQRKALATVVICAYVFTHSGNDYDTLVKAETESGNLLIWSDDLGLKSDVGSRKELIKIAATAERLLNVANLLFLDSLEGIEHDAAVYDALSETALALVKNPMLAYRDKKMS